MLKLVFILMRPQNGGEQSDVIVEHSGDIYYMTGDVENALKFWKKALEMGSKSATIKRKLNRKIHNRNEKIIYIFWWHTYFGNTFYFL